MTQNERMVRWRLILGSESQDTFLRWGAAASPRRSC